MLRRVGLDAVLQEKRDVVGKVLLAGWGLWALKLYSTTRRMGSSKGAAGVKHAAKERSTQGATDCDVALRVVTADRTNHVLVKVDVGEGKLRTPSDICCVIDISGSMGMEAAIQGAGGGSESQGLTLLDVAKHGLRTIAHSLDKNDRLSIVAFNHGAHRVLDLTCMDAAGQKLAERKIDSLVQSGGTDIWEGIREGFESLRAEAMAHRCAHLLVLTDGETNNRERVLPGIAKYRAEYEGLPGTICTFGFGYNLDSQLLTDIAIAGDGSYSFIPDAGFVGTAFVNTISNLLVTVGREAHLTLDVGPGEIVDVVGHEFIEDSFGNVVVNLGLLQGGQSRDIVLTMRAPIELDVFSARLDYVTAGGARKALRASRTGPAGPEVLLPELWRSSYVAVVLKALKTCSSKSIREEDRRAAAKALRSLANDIRASPISNCEKVQQLLEDIEGQSAEAVSKMEFLLKWGRHYMPSIMFAHKLQQCNNFKDPGVQVYGGSLFKELQDEADEIFDKLPAPKPSVALRSSSAPAVPVNMAAYNNRYAG